MKTRVELIDVTESARVMPTHVPGWQVAVSRKAWDQFVRSEHADREEEAGRLMGLLHFFWSSLRNVTDEFSLIAGFGFEIGQFYSDLGSSVTLPARRGTGTAFLHVLSCIGADGRPLLAVLSLDEAGS